MCKVVKWKYSSHIIYELCFHLAFGVSTFVWWEWKKVVRWRNAQRHIKALHRFFPSHHHHPHTLSIRKENIFACDIEHVQCSVFGEYLRMCFFSFSLKTMQKSTPCTLSVLCWLVDVRTIKAILAEILWINVSYEINLEVNLFLCVCYCCI